MGIHLARRRLPYRLSRSSSYQLGPLEKETELLLPSMSESFKLIKGVLSAGDLLSLLALWSARSIDKLSPLFAAQTCMGKVPWDAFVNCCTRG